MTRHNTFSLVFVLGISIIPILSVHMPRALSFLPCLFGVLMSLSFFFDKTKKLHFSKTYAFYILAICALCLVSSIWSLAPQESLIRASTVSVILATSIPLFAISQSICKETFRPYAWIFPVSVACAALLCSFEMAFQLPIYKLSHGIEPRVGISTAVMNRGIICTVFSYMVALLFLQQLSDKPALQKALMIFMTCALLLMLVLTQSQSAQLAFIVGMITLFIFPYKYSNSHKGLLALIAIAMASTPFIIQILYENLIITAQDIPWLSEGYAGNRIEIWGFVIQYALQNPFYGYGIEATRYVPFFEHGHMYHKSNTVLHPHNFSVQLWMEFGVIGVVTGMIVLRKIILSIAKTEIRDRKILTAILVMVVVVASISYGLWQSWWLGEFVFIFFLCSLMTNNISVQKELES